MESAVFMTVVLGRRDLFTYNIPDNPLYFEDEEVLTLRVLLVEGYLVHDVVVRCYKGLQVKLERLNCPKKRRVKRIGQVLGYA